MEQATNDDGAIQFSNPEQQAQFPKEEMLALVAGGRAIKSVAEEYGINHWTLRNWVRAANGKYTKKRGRPKKQKDAHPSTVVKVEEKRDLKETSSYWRQRCRDLEVLVIALTSENLMLRGRREF
jgi:transposase-like protein